MKDEELVFVHDVNEEDSNIAELEALESLPNIENTVTIDNNEEYLSLVLKYSGDHKKATFEYCFIHNIFFNGEVLDLLLNHGRDEDFAKMPYLYIETIKSDFRCKDLTFFDQLKIENFEKIYSEDLLLLSLSEDDKKNRQQIIDILGTDPFMDDDPSDRPQLYRDLTGMLTEAMRKDVPKAKAALAVVRGYNNVDKYQQRINDLMNTGQIDEDTQKKLDAYIKMQKTVQDSINATAEKNNFTIKGIGSNGRGMLSDVMNQVEERGYDKGITNFYDIATSKSIEEVANISWKAQLNQLSLSKTDYCDILASQAEIVRESQRKAFDAVEALRLAKEKITKQELLEELERDYRRKGISEEEIKEFIGREYHLKDGKD